MKKRLYNEKNEKKLYNKNEIIKILYNDNNMIKGYYDKKT